MWKKRMIWTLTLLALAAAGVYAYHHFTEQAAAAAAAQAPAIQTVMPERASLRIVVESTGRIEPNLEVEIKAKASGQVIKLPFDVSDEIKADDVLVQLDPVDEERSVKRAEIKLAVSQARLAQARIHLAVAEQNLATDRDMLQTSRRSAEARLREARAKYERMKQLLEERVVPQETYDSAEMQHVQAQSDLAAVKVREDELKAQEMQLDVRRSEIRIAEEETKTDEIALQDAQQRLSETTIRAPMDGVISERNVQTGQIIASGINNVGGGTTLLRLADLSRIYVLGSVDESEIGKIAVGQPVTVTVDAFPDMRFPGEVRRVATRGVDVSNVVTFEVKIEVLGKRKSLLKPQMTANLEITAYENENALLLPVQALQRRRGTAQVMVVPAAGGEAVAREVTAGHNDGEKIEILAGLEEGDLVQLDTKSNESNWRKEGGDAARQDRMRMRMMGGMGGRR